MEKTLFVTAQDVSEIMGISISKSYKIISALNKELKEKGFYTISGKVNRRYFEEKCLYGSAV
ncbi:MAG: DNA-binding protein [Firmicutes bacterium]|nr:DNA-binding protein [Bacillota bacterium]